MLSMARTPRAGTPRFRSWFRARIGATITAEIKAGRINGREALQMIERYEGYAKRWSRESFERASRVAALSDPLRVLEMMDIFGERPQIIVEMSDKMFAALTVRAIADIVQSLDARFSPSERITVVGNMHFGPRELHPPSWDWRTSTAKARKLFVEHPEIYWDVLIAQTIKTALEFAPTHLRGHIDMMAGQWRRICDEGPAVDRRTFPVTKTGAMAAGQLRDL